MYETIAVETQGKVARITLSREEKRNAISPTMMTELLDAFKKYDDDPDVLVIVLTGAGDRVFCAGADFAESMGATSSFLDRYEGQRRFAELFKVIKGLKKPLIGRINTGERVEAKEALELGLVNHVVPREQLDAKVDEIAQKIVKKSPATLRLGRRAFYTMRDMEYEKALEYLVSMLAINTEAEDLREGIAAFMEKREPEWKGK